MSDDIFDDYIGTNPNGKYPCEEGEIGRCGCPKHKGGPISAPSDWAMEEARKVFYSVNLSGLKYQSAATDLVRNIALALDAARKVPEGCVRLPDGRDVKVLGTLPMTADGCVVAPGARVHYNFIEGTETLVVFGTFAGQFDCGMESNSEWTDVRDSDKCYSTREAAEAERKTEST